MLPRRLEALAAALRLPPAPRILDYGCADVPYRSFFAADADYVAADLPGNPQATLELAPDASVPGHEESFDAVVSTQVLEHVVDPAGYLAECFRVLRPGGAMLLSTHGVFVYHPDPVDYWRWTCAGLQRQVEDAGFEVEEFEGIIGLAATGLQLFQDAFYYQLPRWLQPPFAAVMQLLVAVGRQRSLAARPQLGCPGVRAGCPQAGAAEQLSAIHIGCVAEGDYAPHSAAMLHSVLGQCGGQQVHIHYLHPPEFPADALQRLRVMVETAGARIDFLAVDDHHVEGLPTAGFTGKATWYRILLPELLPGVERILLLDADLIALDSLTELWETDLGSAHLAAVTNVFQHDHLYRAAQLGLDRPEAYFNAGVMLMNLASMREAGCTDALREYGVEHAPELVFRDQDALNAVLSGHRLALHPRWNCMNSMFMFSYSAYVFGARALEEARRRPAIRHFEGPGANKPWHLLSRSQMREDYFEARRATPWPRVRREGVTPGNVIRLIRRGARAAPQNLTAATPV